MTLQELMDEEDILQECKAQNKALIELLVVRIVGLLFIYTTLIITVLYIV